MDKNELLNSSAEAGPTRGSCSEKGMEKTTAEWSEKIFGIILLSQIRLLGWFEAERWSVYTVSSLRGSSTYVQVNDSSFCSFFFIEQIMLLIKALRSIVDAFLTQVN